jgi:hypothetical protein
MELMNAMRKEITFYIVDTAISDLFPWGNLAEA